MRTGARPYVYSPKGASRRFTNHSITSGAPGDVRGLYAAMRRYLEHRAVQGSTAQGLHTTERIIRDFTDWADERGVTHPSQVSRAVLERYQKWLYYYRKKDGQPLSIVSQTSRVGPLRSFFRWLTKTAEIPANPAADLDMPRQIQRLPRQVLSEEEAEAVLALPDLTTLVGLRDRAMLEVLYATGMRRMEITSLACGDIDTARCLVLIRQGKGRKDRLIPLGARALHWVQRYLHEVRPQLAWDQNIHQVFLGQEGHPLGQDQLSGRVAKYVRQADLGKQGGCHLWRHTMATLMLEGGADTRFIQVMLGHSLLSTTQIYTRVAVTQLQKVHARTHPGAALRVRSAADALAEQDTPTPEPDPQHTPQRLLEALAREAEDESEDAGKDENEDLP